MLFNSIHVVSDASPLRSEVLSPGQGELVVGPGQGWGQGGTGVHRLGSLPFRLCSLPSPSYRMIQEPPLPPGWEMKYTAEGVRYFVDHNSRATSFKDPRPGFESG